MPLPRIAVTMGDPAGVGPELSLRLASTPHVLERSVPVLFGDAGVFRAVAQRGGVPDVPPVMPYGQWRDRYADVREPTVVDLAAIDAATVRPGEVSGDTGLASYRYVETAIAAAMADEVAAVATGPIHKEALHAAGLPYPGHTEIFTEKTGAERSCMMLTSDQITCSLVTTHVGYGDVPGQLTVERIVEVIELTHHAMEQLRGRAVKIVVCGLNPHAGESGLFGDREEERLIVPAIAAARAWGIDVEGPLPPDTAFIPARRLTTDAFVCMYHDQGLIPLKTLAFDKAINITLGLPIIRTSVDHGTALDIAWAGRADPGSLIEAVLLAARLAGAEAV